MPKHTKFNFDPEDREWLCAIGCWICGDTEVALVPDHDHEIDYFRGMLCHHCNVGLGFFRDKPDMLRRAADYLEERMLTAFGDICHTCGPDSPVYAPREIRTTSSTQRECFYRCTNNHCWICHYHVDAWLAVSSGIMPTRTRK